MFFFSNTYCDVQCMRDINENNSWSRAIDTDSINEGSIIAIIAVDESTQCADEIKVEEPKAPNDPLTEVTPHVDIIDMKIEDCTIPPVNLPPGHHR